MTVLGPSFAKQILANKTLYRFIKPIADSYANLTGYRQIGLKYDDIIIEENKPVQRALSRLPPQEQYDRAYRLRVATNQSVLHHDLPKDMWTTPSEDVRYLTPLIEEALKEDAERAAWDGAIIQKAPKKH